MRNFRMIVMRNLTLFLDNKLNILLSVMSVIIILSLYFIFLRDFMLAMVENHGVPQELCGLVSDRFMVAGVLIVVSTTTCFGTIQARVKDKETGIIKDYLTAPVSRSTLNMAYVTATGLVSASFSILTFITLEFYFYYEHASELTTGEALEVMGILILASFINALILFIISEFIENTTDFSTFANLYGTIIGFLAGAYLPYFFYAKWLKKILFYLPCTQLTSVIRDVVTKDVLTPRKIRISPEQIEQLKVSFGILLKDGEKIVSKQSEYEILFVESAVLLLIVLGFTKRKINRIYTY